MLRYKIKTSVLKVYNTQQHSIAIWGENNEASNKEIYDNAMENRNFGKAKEFGWSQCFAIWVKIIIFDF